MKRTIKFRAWDNENGYMVRSDRGVYTALRHVLNVSVGSGFSDIDTSAKPLKYEASQYSGINDKNGKEVYEGDIIRFAYKDICEEGGIGYCSGVVAFEDGCFVVKEPNFNYDKHCMPQTLWEWIQDEQCEVIGNIYENKELFDI